MTSESASPEGSNEDVRERSSECPDEDKLVRLVEGALGAASLSAIEAHVDGCDQCAAVIANLGALGGLGAAARLGGPGMHAMHGTPGMHGTHGLADAPRRVGRYQLDRRIAAGGMGEVWAAWDPQVRREIAIKLVRPDRAEDGKERDRLLREARALGRLTHPNVLAVHDVGEVDGEVFLATELVAGDTLATRGGASADWRTLVRWYVQAARGLAAAHAAGLVHRDVKPANLLLGADGRVRVADFGLAVRASTPSPIAPTQTPSFDASSPITAAGFVAGTPAYMAPEQRAGGPVDAPADQFALCIALGEAIAGRRPAADLDRAALIAFVSERRAREPALDEVLGVIARGLALEPAARFPDMGALADALEAIVDTRDGRAGSREPIAGTRDAIAGTRDAIAGTDDTVASLRGPIAGTRDPIAGTRDAVAGTGVPIAATRGQVADGGADRAGEVDPAHSTLQTRRSRAPIAIALGVSIAGAVGLWIALHDRGTSGSSTTALPTAPSPAAAVATPAALPTPTATPSRTETAAIVTAADHRGAAIGDAAHPAVAVGRPVPAHPASPARVSRVTDAAASTPGTAPAGTAASGAAPARTAASGAALGTAPASSGPFAAVDAAVARHDASSCRAAIAQLPPLTKPSDLEHLDLARGVCQMIAGDCAGGTRQVTDVMAHMGNPQATTAAGIYADQYCRPDGDVAQRMRRLVAQTDKYSFDCDQYVTAARAAAAAATTDLEKLQAGTVLANIGKCFSMRNRCDEARAILDEAVVLIPNLSPAGELTRACR